MSSLAEFTKEMNAAAAKLPDLTNKVIRKVAFDLHREIVRQCPVDTGRLRANFQIGINQTNTDELMATGIPNTERDKLQRFELGDVIHIFQNLVYIMPIEFDGTSQQAPAGFIRSEVVRSENKLQEALKAINNL